MISPALQCRRRRNFRTRNRFRINSRSEEIDDFRSRFDWLRAEVFKTNAQIVLAQLRLAVFRCMKVYPRPKQQRALGDRMENAFAQSQNRGSMLPQLNLIGRKRHVPAIAQDMDEFQTRLSSVQKTQ